MCRILVNGHDLPTTLAFDRLDVSSDHVVHPQLATVVFERLGLEESALQGLCRAAVVDLAEVHYPAALMRACSLYLKRTAGRTQPTARRQPLYSIGCQGYEDVTTDPVGSSDAPDL